MSALESLDLTAWHFKLPSRSKELGSRLFEVRFHRFPGAQIFVYKRLQINSCSKCFWRWRDSRNSEGVGCRMRGRTKNSTRSHKRGPQPKSAKRGLVERGQRTWSVREHPRDESPLPQMTSWCKPGLTYRKQSRVWKRQFVMRKDTSTIVPSFLAITWPTQFITILLENTSPSHDKASAVTFPNNAEPSLESLQ